MTTYQADLDSDVALLDQTAVTAAGLGRDECGGHHCASQRHLIGLYQAREALAAAKVDVFFAAQRSAWLPGTRRRRAQALARLATAQEVYAAAEQRFTDGADDHGLSLDLIREVDSAYL